MSVKFPDRQIETAPGLYPDIAYGTNLIKRPLWPPVTMLISSAIGRAQLLHLTPGRTGRKSWRLGKKGHAKKGVAEQRNVAQRWGRGGAEEAMATTKMTATDAGRRGTRGDS